MNVTNVMVSERSKTQKRMIANTLYKEFKKRKSIKYIVVGRKTS